MIFLSGYDDWLSAPYDNPAKKNNEELQEEAESIFDDFSMEQRIDLLPTVQQSYYRNIFEQFRNAVIEEIIKDLR